MRGPGVLSKARRPTSSVVPLVNTAAQISSQLLSLFIALPFLVYRLDNLIYEMDFAFQWNLSENRSKKILGVKFYPQGQKHFERLKEHASLSDTGVVPVDVVDVIFNINTEEDGDGDDYEENNDAVQKEEEEGDDDDDDEKEVETGMSPWNVYLRFCRVVNDALIKLTLLPDWQHGGFASPACSGTRENGPALMMQFNYNKENGENGENLKLTVDLVLAMDLREIYDGDLDELCTSHMGSSWQRELLRKKNCLDTVLTKIYHDVLLDSTFAERMWLSTMDIDHPVKISIRFFKILNQIALQDPSADMRIDSSLYSVDENRMMWLEGLRR